MALAPRPPAEPEHARMLAEAEAMRAARDGHRRTVEARRIGVMVLLDVGVTIWSSLAHDADGLALIGGVVVQISEGERDPDSGFIARRFVCLNPFAGPRNWEHTIDEGDVSPEATEATDNARIVQLITRLQAEGGKRKSRILTPRDGRLIEYERALKAVVLPS